MKFKEPCVFCRMETIGPTDYDMIREVADLLDLSYG